MLTGWFMLKGEWPYPLPLLDLKKDTTSIFALKYNMISSEFSFLFKANTDT